MFLQCRARGSSLECFFHSPSMSGEICCLHNEIETCNLQHNIAYTERNTLSRKIFKVTLAWDLVRSFKKKKKKSSRLNFLRLLDKTVFQHCLCDFKLLPDCDKGKSSPYTVISMNAAECLQWLCRLSKFTGFKSPFSFYVLLLPPSLACCIFVFCYIWIDWDFKLI